VKTYYSYEEIESTIKKIVAEEFNTEVHLLSLDTQFVADLGTDSLDTVELVMALEEAFDFNISDDDGENMRTVGDAVEFVCNQLNVEPKAPRRIEGFSFRSAIEQRAIYFMTVHGFSDGHRWSSVKEWLHKEMGGSTTTKKGKAAMKRIKPEIITTLSDPKLLELYEIVVRQWSKQM